MQPPTQSHEQYTSHLLAAAQQIIRQIQATGAVYILMDLRRLTTQIEIGTTALDLPDGLRQETLPSIIVALYGRNRKILYSSLADLDESITRHLSNMP